MLQKLTYIEMPLYTKNSLYFVQVIAFTASSERIASDTLSFHSSEFISAGLDEAITYFQLRLILPLDCSTWINRVLLACQLAQSSALKNEAVEVKQVATVWLYHFSYRSYTVDSTKNPLVCAIKLP